MERNVEKELGLATLFSSLWQANNSQIYILPQLEQAVRFKAVTHVSRSGGGP